MLDQEGGGYIYCVLEIFEYFTGKERDLNLQIKCEIMDCVCLFNEEHVCIKSHFQKHRNDCET